MTFCWSKVCWGGTSFTCALLCKTDKESITSLPIQEVCVLCWEFKWVVDYMYYWNKLMSCSRTWISHADGHFAWPCTWESKLSSKLPNLIFWPNVCVPTSGAQSTVKLLSTLFHGFLSDQKGDAMRSYYLQCICNVEPSKLGCMLPNTVFPSKLGCMLPNTVFPSKLGCMLPNTVFPSKLGCMLPNTCTAYRQIVMESEYNCGILFTITFKAF